MNTAFDRNIYGYISGNCTVLFLSNALIAFKKRARWVFVALTSLRPVTPTNNQYKYICTSCPPVTRVIEWSIMSIGNITFFRKD